MNQDDEIDENNLNFLNEEVTQYFNEMEDLDKAGKWILTLGLKNDSFNMSKIISEKSKSNRSISNKNIDVSSNKIEDK